MRKAPRNRADREEHLRSLKGLDRINNKRAHLFGQEGDQQELPYPRPSEASSGRPSSRVGFHSPMSPPLGLGKLGNGGRSGGSHQGLTPPGFTMPPPPGLGRIGRS